MKNNYFGIGPINEEQKELFRLLDDPKVQVIATTGPAGTGKSLCLGAYILDMIFNKEFQKVVFSKPMEVVGHGRFMGAVPGDEKDKFAPFLLNYRYLFEKLAGSNGAAYFDEAANRGTIKFIPVDLMRGVSFPPGTIVYMDECQNIDEHTINTLGTRLEDGTRLFLSGDLNQIDVRTGTFNSGLAKVVRSSIYQESDITGHVHLTQVERGPIAKLFTDIFEAK